MPHGLIGLSLSHCIRDILDGLVSLDKVLRISAGTKIVTDEDLDYVIAVYRDTYWTRDPDRAERIARAMFSQGLIDQPRVRAEPPLPWNPRETPRHLGPHWICHSSTD